MLGKSSPFKKLTHSRSGSTDDHNSHYIHRRSVSASSQGPPVSGHKRNASRTSNSSVSSNFLAEQYDRDRRSIIASCFGQTEGGGSRPSKTYVTHVRIIEDGRYPSSRPPANSPLTNKKKRVLVISSKTNGSGMQLHKARENSNGSFQIGRTWDLRELMSIERDVDQAEGFMLTMSKKYYWETNSAKERTVFIKSLVKIYMENSGGHVPTLVNWDLSMFYLDEKSYERALVQSGNKKVQQAGVASQASRQEFTDHEAKKEALPARIVKPLAPQSDTQPRDHSPMLLPPQSVQHKINATLQGQVPPLQPAQKSLQHQVERETTQPPVQHSLHQPIQGVSQQPVQRPIQKPTKEPIMHMAPSQSLSPSQVYESPKHPLNTLPSAQYSASSRGGPLSKSPYSQTKVIDQVHESFGPASLAKTQSTDQSSFSTNGQPDETSNTQTEEADNFLAELNSVLTSPAQDVEFVGHKKSYDEVEAETESIPEDAYEDAEEKEDEDFAELYGSASSFEGDSTVQDGLDNDDTNELSFEKGDEVRFSQILESPNSHDYHEVSTIREEPSAYPQYDFSTRLENIPAKSTKATDCQALLEILDDVNWDVDDDCNRLLEKLHSKLAETEHAFNNKILSLPEHSEDYSSYRSNVMKECDKLDPILSFFVIEMSTVSRDIEYVESQANGLQVESANKKILWKELSEILNSVSIDESSLNELLSLPLSERNLETIERLLLALYTALKAIRGDDHEKELNLGEMRALKERRQAYEKITGLFLRRAVEEMDKKFQTFGHDNVSNEQLGNILSRMMIYSSLVLFCKDVSVKSYSEIIEEWNRDIQSTYEKRTLSIINSLKPSMINNSQTSQTTPQGPPGLDLLLARWQSQKTSEDATPIIPSNSEFLTTISTSIAAMESLCVTYQNFIDGFFHVGGNTDFPEYVTAYPDLNSRIKPLDKVGEMELDRESSSLKTQLVVKVFQPLFAKYSGALLQLVKHEQLLAPVIMFFLESETYKFKLSNQEFLMSAFKKIFEKISQEWQDFVDDQVVYIERAVIDLKSKKISPVIMGFPIFIQNLDDEISFVKNHLKLNSASFVESQKILDKSFKDYGNGVIALLLREDENRTSNMHSSGSPEDALDECVSLLANANWLTEMLPLFQNTVFGDFIKRTKKVFDQEKERYSEILVKSAMNHLYSFVEGAYGLVEASRARPVDPSRWAAYSRQNLNKILDRYTSHEITTLIERLYGYLERDFLSGKASIINSQLCDKLWSCIQGQTVSLYLKLYTLIDKHYKGTPVKFTKNDIITAFNDHKKDY